MGRHIPNSRIANALDLLRSEPRSEVYEGAASARNKAGRGEFFVTFSNGTSPTLTRDDVSYMVEHGWIVQYPDCQYLFKRGPKLATEGGDGR